MRLKQNIHARMLLSIYIEHKKEGIKLNWYFRSDWGSLSNNKKGEEIGDWHLT